MSLFNSIIIDNIIIIDDNINSNIDIKLNNQNQLNNQSHLINLYYKEYLFFNELQNNNINKLNISIYSNIYLYKIINYFKQTNKIKTINLKFNNNKDKLLYLDNILQINYSKINIHITNFNILNNDKFINFISKIKTINKLIIDCNIPLQIVDNIKCKFNIINKLTILTKCDNLQLSEIIKNNCLINILKIYSCNTNFIINLLNNNKTLKNIIIYDNIDISSNLINDSIQKIKLYSCKYDDITILFNFLLNCIKSNILFKICFNYKNQSNYDLILTLCNKHNLYTNINDDNLLISIKNYN